MAQHHPEIAAFHAEKHLTLAERNEAYAAAVRFANDRGVSHLNFLPGEQASRVVAKGFYVPTTEDRVLPLHCDPEEIAVIQEEHPGSDMWDTPCDGSFTKTETGECGDCGRVFCTDTGLPMMAEITGEKECGHAEHCYDCGSSKAAIYPHTDTAFCSTCAEKREALALSLTDAAV